MHPSFGQNEYEPWSAWISCGKSEICRGRNCLGNCLNAKIFQRKGCRNSSCDDLISTKGQTEHLSTATFLVQSASLEATTSGRIHSQETTTSVNMPNGTEPHQKDIVQIIPTSTAGIGLLVTLGLTLLVIFNLVFTLYFYRAWKKRQKVRSRQSMIEMSPYDGLRSIPRAQREDLYSNIRESLFTDAGTYTTIRSRDGDVDGTISDRSRLLRVVPSQRGCNREKVKTLTTLFELHSKDVKQTLSEMKSVNITGE
ncbi:uncharacterized protein LOC125648101 [Ostrea edulis]|uniref:uncharacterized protein LOC125648101 n=1 Tax=Ostrea edulis TaxID=37623 RepID=UPI0024AFBA92|nr:uncharacterized protein LOC125648101 [Ostrea edulis]